MKAEKQFLLDEVKDQIVDRKDFVLMRYQKLTANAATQLRDGVAKAGGCTKVIRKRVLLKAAEQAGVTIDMGQLEGHIGVCFPGDDSVAVAKVVADFGKDNADAVELVGGHIEGQVLDAAQMKALAQLPGKDQLRAEIVGLLAAPASEVVGLINAVLSSLVYCVENKIAQSE